MTDEIKKAVTRQLRQARLPADALNKPDAQVLVKGDANTLHVLVPPNAPVDVLEAAVVGAKGVKLTVEEHNEVDLGPEYGGEWRNFAVSGFEDAPTIHPGARSTSVAITGKSDATGDEFVPVTTIDLGLIVDMLRDPKADVVVRPIPAGEREGVRWMEVTPELRRLVGATLQRHVDDTVSEDVLNSAIAQLQKQNFDMQRWIAVAQSLGLPVVARQVPHPAADAVVEPTDDAAPAGPVSAQSRQWLDDHGLGISDSPSASDLADVLDGLPDDVPETVAAEVRTAWVEAQDHEANAAATANAAEIDDMFGDFAATVTPAQDAAPAADGPKVIVGDAEVAEARAYRYGQVKEGLAPLGVDEATVRKLAELVNLAATPSEKPSVIIIAGRTATPADSAMDIAKGITVRGELTIGGAELAKPGFGAVFGHNNGVPTGSGSVLSEEALTKGRTGGRKAGIVVDDLTQAGSALTEGQENVLVDWLKTVAITLDTGYTKTYSIDDDEHKKVPLGETVWLMRYPGDAGELTRLIDAHPELHALKRFVVSIDSDADMNVRQLERELQKDARTVADVKIEFGPELREKLVATFDRATVPAEASALVKQMMSEAILHAAATAPAAKYTIDFNTRELTAKDRDKLMSGRPLLGVTQPYVVKAAIGDEEFTIEYGRAWKDVKSELDVLRATVAALRSENESLKAEVRMAASAPEPAPKKTKKKT